MRIARVKARRAVVLVSGGLDSALVLKLAVDAGYKVHTLCFDYGQSNRKEIDYARQQSLRYAGVELNVVRLDYRALSGGSAMLNGDTEKLATLTMIPWRTAVFVNMAVAYAESVDARYVFVGNQIDSFDAPPSKDARYETYDYVHTLLGDLDVLARRHAHVSVVAPLILLNKQSILRLANTRRITLDTTWSCLRGEKDPCGTCKTCKQISGAAS